MIGILFTGCALATVPGTIELALLTVAAARNSPPRGLRPPVDGSSLRIVIPAHDEESSIDATLEHVLARLPSGMSPREVLVVADNCTDATAAVARRHGVRVIERQVAKSRGKGHALHDAFAQLLEHDPGAERFLVLDADARLGPSAIDELLCAFDAGAAAVQASYRVAEPDLDARSGLLNLAWLCFNHLRPLGRQRLGLSVGILGNGFGLTRDVLAAVPYQAGSVVEDLEYHLRLVEAGFCVQFVPTARVLAAAAPTAGAERTQRVRWEGGRLRMLIDHLPRLALQVLRGKRRYVEPALELALLPLALHGTLLALGIASGGYGSVIAGVGLVVLALHVFAGAFLVGRGSRDLMALAHAPAHVARKLALLPAIVRGSSKSTSWKRTDRAA